MKSKKQADKLSQEAAQARAAGMSYGKWKGLQPFIPIEPKKKPEINYEHNCEYCGTKVFDYRNCKHWFCCKRCEYNWREETKRRKAQAEAMK